MARQLTLLGLILLAGIVFVSAADEDLSGLAIPASGDSNSNSIGSMKDNPIDDADDDDTTVAAAAPLGDKADSYLAPTYGAPLTPPPSIDTAQVGADGSQGKSGASMLKVPAILALPIVAGFFST